MVKNQSSLWSPSEDLKKKSKLSYFCKRLEKKKLIKYPKKFKDLWKWSVQNSEIFWSEVWDFTKIKGIKGKNIIKKNSIFYKNIFFPQSKLNYAENLLSKKNNDTAINFISENGFKKRYHGKN